MKKLIAYPTLIILLLTITNCGSKPSEMDAIKELRGRGTTIGVAGQTIDFVMLDLLGIQGVVI